jgi:hypothetical protein
LIQALRFLHSVIASPPGPRVILSPGIFPPLPALFRSSQQGGGFKLGTTEEWLLYALCFGARSVQLLSRLDVLRFRKYIS